MTHSNSLVKWKEVEQNLHKDEEMCKLHDGCVCFSDVLARITYHSEGMISHKEGEAVDVHV